MFYFIFTHNFYRCRPWNESICQKVAQGCWIVFDLGLQCTICTIPNDDFCAITDITNIPITLWSLNSDQVKFIYSEKATKCCEIFPLLLTFSTAVKSKEKILQKGLFNLAQACIVDGDFWVPNEIDSWNFQHMLLFWFREASQNLSLFRQLFFS